MSGFVAKMVARADTDQADWLVTVLVLTLYRTENSAGLLVRHMSHLLSM